MAGLVRSQRAPARDEHRRPPPVPEMVLRALAGRLRQQPCRRNPHLDTILCHFPGSRRNRANHETCERCACRDSETRLLRRRPRSHPRNRLQAWLFVGGITVSGPSSSLLRRSTAYSRAPEFGELPTLGCAGIEFECRYAPDYVGTAWRFAIYAMTKGVGDHAHDAGSLSLRTGSKVSSRALRKRDDTERPLPLPASTGSSSVVGFASSIKPTTGR